MEDTDNHVREVLRNVMELHGFAWPDERLQEDARDAGVEAVVPKGAGVDALARAIGAAALR